MEEIRQKTFFEYLTIANTERVHSQVIAWLFSKDFRALQDKDKIKLLERFLSLNGIKEIVNIVTEYDKLDILIETDKLYIAIENKFTSTVKGNQLNNYEDNIDKLAAENNKTAVYFLLSLSGELATYTDKWKSVTYTNLIDSYQHMTFTDNNHKIMISEYFMYLEKTEKVLDLFLKNTDQFEFVFLDGNKKKSEKVNIHYSDDASAFIAFNQLETIFQRILLETRMRNIPDLEYEYHISESHGFVILDIYLTNRIIVNNKEFRVFLEIQKSTTKFAIGLYGLDYTNSTKADIAPFIISLNNINNNFGYKKVNGPRSKAFCSLSKQDRPWWQLSQNEFYEMLHFELLHTETLKNMIKEDLHQRKIEFEDVFI